MKRTLLKFAGVSMLAAGMALAQNAPAPNTQGQTGHKTAHHARRSMLDRLSAKLNLTDAQKAQAKTIFANARQAAQPVRDQLKTQRQALRAAVKSGAPEAQIDQITSQMGPLMAQSTAIRTKAFEKFYSILTPEQQNQLGQHAMNRRPMNRRHAG